MPPQLLLITPGWINLDSIFIHNHFFKKKMQNRRDNFGYLTRQLKFDHEKWHSTHNLQFTSVAYSGGGECPPFCMCTFIPFFRADWASCPLPVVGSKIFN